jgi:16S rRNA (cytosine1402-N4)-methyltransferase
MSNFHKPVLLQEVLDFLEVKKDGRYIDSTLGGGGHTREILKRGASVLGIDFDEEAIEYVKNSRPNIDNFEKLTIAKGNFKDIDKIAHLNNFDRVDGILLDLGLSSFQISSERGFSYQKEGPLDMRMDKNFAVKAADLVNILTKGELDELFSKLGEERSARLISERIVKSRGIKKIETTQDLIEAIAGRRYLTPHERARFSKKVFQALRIAVNDELNNLKEVLPKAISLLGRGGKMIVISFHSLEDRIVKREYEKFQKEGLGEIVTKSPVVPKEAEMSENRRSKSAKMRVFMKYE